MAFKIDIAQKGKERDRFIFSIGREEERERDMQRVNKHR